MTSPLKKNSLKKLKSLSNSLDKIALQEFSRRLPTSKQRMLLAFTLTLMKNVQKMKWTRYSVLQIGLVLLKFWQAQQQPRISMSGQKRTKERHATPLKPFQISPVQAVRAHRQAREHLLQQARQSRISSLRQARK